MQMVRTLLLACVVLLLLHPHRGWARPRVTVAGHEDEDISPVSAATPDSEESGDEEIENEMEQGVPEAEEPKKPKADIVMQARDLYEVEGDEKGAIPLFEEAVAAGNDDAMVLLGRIYEARCVCCFP